MKARLAHAVLALLAIAACGAPPEAPRAVAPHTRPTPAAAELFHTQDSDAWVRHVMRVQTTYPRVLAVAPGEAPREVRVGPLDLDARARRHGPEASLRVDQAFHSLQEAADAARGGDLVAVLPGRYTGFSMGDKPDAGDGRFVHFLATGAPGEVTIDRPAKADGGRWMIYLAAAHHVIVEGFEVAGSAGRNAARAGIMLDGDFGRSGKLAHHLVIVGNFSHHHRDWGLHATDTRTVLLQDNLFALSADQHSAYVSDGSDDYVIRRNVFFGSSAAGLQVNLDPEASLDEVLKHPALAGHPRNNGTRAWAERLIERATAIFGARNFPDGRGEGFIIEENVINGNGARGAAALNFAGLQHSLIQNNLLYGNLAHGIAQWDNRNAFDADAVDPGPRDAKSASDPAILPIFGCHDNVIRNNTVVMANKRRAAFQAIHGSYGSAVHNNVLVNDERWSFEVSNTAMWRLDARANVVNTVGLVHGADALLGVALAVPDAAHAATGITRERLAAEVARAGEEPWVIVEGSWWRLNPARPDFHPRIGSTLLAGKGDAKEMPARDLEGAPRTQADIGALSAR